MEKIKVKILLSTYNGEKYLSQLVESLIIQRDVEISILVRDDGSTDKTQEMLDAWQSQGILTWYKGENLKPAKSFMHLINYADDADYYAFCDQDDVWDNDKLVIAVNELEKHKKCIPAMYFSSARIVDRNLNHFRDYVMNSTLEFGPSLIASNAQGCTMVINKELATEIRRYNPEFLAMHDCWIHKLCLALDGICYYDERPHISYRQHESNVTGGMNSLNKYNYFAKIMNFFNQIHTNPYISEKTANEILLGYKNSMSDKNILLAECVANYRKSLRNRLRLLFSKEIKTNYLKTDLIYKVRIILGIA